MENKLKKILLAAVLVFAAVLSFFPIANFASKTETHTASIASLDEKATSVLKLTAATTLTSAGVSAIPGDTATPIAEKLADFTEYFLLVLCVLYAEKYLLTIIGAGAFRVLIPLALLLLVISLFWNPRTMKRLAVKLLVFALTVCVTIPISIKVSDMIYTTYRGSIDYTLNAAEDLTDETSQLDGVKEDAGLLQKVLGELSETVSSLADKAARTLNYFVEALAVLIVTSCVIPVLVIVFFVWLIRLLTGARGEPHPFGHHRPHPESGRPEGEPPTAPPYLPE